MKKYRFAVHNWKCDLPIAFWIVKPFPSAYYAYSWADRISFKKKSMYIVVCEGEGKVNEIYNTDRIRF